MRKEEDKDRITSLGKTMEERKLLETFDELNLSNDQSMVIR